MDLSHRQSFEVVDAFQFLERIDSTFRGVMVQKLKKKYLSITRLLYAPEFKHLIAESGAFIFNDDYFAFNDEMDLVADICYSYHDRSYNYDDRRKILSINHNMIKSMMKKEIIKPLDEATIAKLYLIAK